MFVSDKVCQYLFEWYDSWCEENFPLISWVYHINGRIIRDCTQKQAMFLKEKVNEYENILTLQEAK